MAFYIEGKHFSYDYSKILAEIKEDIAEGILSMNDSINVVRGDKIIGDYRPIIDYYYTDFADTIMQPLEEIYSKEDYTPAEWNKLVKETEESINQYEKDKNSLELISVSRAISEMEELNGII